MKITIDTDNLETLKYKTEDVPILMKTFQQLINKLMYEVIGNYYSVDNVPEDTPKWVKEELLNVEKTCYGIWIKNIFLKVFKKHLRIIIIY